MKSKRIFLLVVLLVSGVLASCIARQPRGIPGAPGFWFGLWHGFISPIAFVVSLVTHHRIYAFPNSGRWYDFGFMLGIGGFSGGIFGASRRRK